MGEQQPRITDAFLLSQMDSEVLKNTTQTFNGPQPTPGCKPQSQKDETEDPRLLPKSVGFSGTPNHKEGPIESPWDHP